MNMTEWYEQLARPSFAPPSYVFGIAWGIIYPIIFITFGYTFYAAYKQEIPRIVALPFALNLFFNFIFTTIQFGLKNNLLAAVDIALVVGTLIWAIVLVYPHRPIIAYLQAPYLAWGLFATALQFSITYLNWS